MSSLSLQGPIGETGIQGPTVRGSLTPEHASLIAFLGFSFLVIACYWRLEIGVHFLSVRLTWNLVFHREFAGNQVHPETRATKEIR